MAVQKIKLNSNIKKFAIENEEGKLLVELCLDTTDDSVMSRFMDLYDNMNEIYNTAQEKLESYSEDEELTIQNAKELLKVSNEAMLKVVEETDNMFGIGFTKQLFADHYKLNPNFIPSVEVMSEFYKQVMPIVSSVYADKTKNYSVKKGGKKKVTANE